MKLYAAEKSNEPKQVPAPLVFVNDWLNEIELPPSGALPVIVPVRGL